MEVEQSYRINKSFPGQETVQRLRGKKVGGEGGSPGSLKAGVLGLRVGTPKVEKVPNQMELPCVLTGLGKSPPDCFSAGQSQSI